jgi:hypothetical protein
MQIDATKPRIKAAALHDGQRNIRLMHRRRVFVGIGERANRA